MSNNPPIQFPKSPGPFDTIVSIKTNKASGLASDIFLQEEARELPLYDYPIIYDEEGHDQEGNTIKVNTLGRWLFGVPGSSKHLVIEPNSQNQEILIHVSSGYPYIVFEFLSSLKNKIESNQ